MYTVYVYMNIGYICMRMSNASTNIRNKWELCFTMRKKLIVGFYLYISEPDWDFDGPPLELLGPSFSSIFSCLFRPSSEAIASMVLLSIRYWYTCNGQIEKSDSTRYLFNVHNHIHTAHINSTHAHPKCAQSCVYIYIYMCIMFTGAVANYHTQQTEQPTTTNRQREKKRRRNVAMEFGSLKFELLLALKRQPEPNDQKETIVKGKYVWTADNSSHKASNYFKYYVVVFFFFGSCAPFASWISSYVSLFVYIGSFRGAWCWMLKQCIDATTEPRVEINAAASKFSIAAHKLQMHTNLFIFFFSR